jgi:glycosyltransferase involved in cell wall biosynthesis
MTAPATPRVSVVMAAHNAERHLREAVDSILGQTLTDFEFIIVDDASSDSTPVILADYARRDPRIRVLRNDINLGPYPSGNRGLEIARAPLIARMDADDVSMPGRLEYEVEFLDSHPDHILVTSGYRAVNQVGRKLYDKVTPADDFGVRWLSRFRMPLVHAAACFRARLPDGTPVRYDESMPIAQDFELFARLNSFGKVAVVAPIFYEYRMHPKNISTTRRREQKTNNLRVALQVQERDLPAHLAGSLTGLLRSYLLGEPATPGLVRDSVAALDRMLAHDIAANPGARVWLRRQAAGILADAILRNGKGFTNPRVVAAFLLHARRYLWPLAWRVLENKGWLPRRLESFPDPEGR